MAYQVIEKADGNGYSRFYVYDGENYIAGPWLEDWQATRFIETQTEDRYMARADRTAVMRGRRSNGKLVLRDERERQSRAVGDIEGDPVRRASRRDVLLGALTATVAAGLARATPAWAEGDQKLPSSEASKGAASMGMITTTDGTGIYYKDWGPRNAQPIVFHHGWPLSGDDWDAQMIFFLDKGYRVIAHDRRGHGRSAQVSEGHDMDHYAADVAAVVEHLDLRNAVHIGHSTGGGEATHYVARHGQPQDRVAKLVLIGAVPPVMVKTPANPGGLPIEVFDGLRKSLAGNRAQFYLDFASGPFYGFNRPGEKPIPGVIQNWWRQAMVGSAKAQYDGIKAFSETDFTDDLKAIKVPTLVMHGDDDQIVPIAGSALLSSKLLKKATLKVYEKFPHGMCTTHADVVNPDLLAFITS